MNRKDVRRLKLLHVHVSPDIRTIPVNIRLPIGLIAAIKREAFSRELPYQHLIKIELAREFPWKPRTVKCGGPGCSPYGNKNWKGPKPKGKKLDMRIRGVEW